MSEEEVIEVFKETKNDQMLTEKDNEHNGVYRDVPDGGWCWCVVAGIHLKQKASEFLSVKC